MPFCHDIQWKRLGCRFKSKPSFWVIELRFLTNTLSLLQKLPYWFDIFILKRAMYGLHNCVQNVALFHTRLYIMSMPLCCWSPLCIYGIIKICLWLRSGNRDVFCCILSPGAPFTNIEPLASCMIVHFSVHILKWELVCKFGVRFHIFIIISCLGSRFHVWN